MSRKFAEPLGDFMKLVSFIEYAVCFMSNDIIAHLKTAGYFPD